MAEAKKKEAAAAAEERVEIYIERAAANDDPNLFVSVNGVNYVLPRGKTSKVQKHVAEEIQRAKRAQDRLDRQIDMMLAAAQQ